MSGLAAFAVRHWQFTLIVFALLVAGGGSALVNIPRAEDPNFAAPIATVAVVLPGADPVAMERLVTDPIEDALDGLEDLDKLTSRTRDGITVITAEFDWDSDPERKYDQVVREVNAVRPSLPAGIVRLEVKKIQINLTNIVQVALVSDTASGRELEERAERLKDAIDRIPGVSESEVWGEPRTEIQVALDLGRLAALALPPNVVAEALAAEGANLSIGTIHAGARRFNVKATGDFDTLEEIADTVVRSEGGRVVRVGDVAHVAWGAAEPDHLARYNGRPAVFVTANQKDGQNIFAVRDAIVAELDRFAATLPPEIRLERGFDQSLNVSDRLSRLARDFAIALALVLVTLLPLGLRAALVVMISIPLSLAVAVWLLQGTGFSLNQLSIAGFVLALGLLVDDSIVVAENIARHLRGGLDRTSAAIAGTRQISVAVVGCTATLMLAFLPLLFLPEGAGKFIRSLPVTVLYTVGASLLVSLTIIPFLASRLLPRHQAAEGNAFLRVLMRGIHGVYRPLLHLALGRPWMTVALAVILFGASLSLIPRIGFSLFPPSDSRQFLVEIDLPDGASLAATQAAVAFAEQQVAAVPGLHWTMGNVGHGNPRIFYNVLPREDDPTHGAVFVELDHWDNRTSPALLDALRRRLAVYPGAQMVVRIFQNGPPIEAPIAIRLLGPEVAPLKALATQMAATMATVPGIRDIINPLRLDRTDLDLGIDTAKAAALGIPAGAIDRTLRLALAGEAVASFREADGDVFPVVARMPLDQRHQLDALAQIYLPAATGAVPLSAISTPRFSGGPARIDRFNRERAVTITAYTATGYNTEAVTLAALEALGRLTLPPSFRIEAGGEIEARAKSFSGLSGAILIALFGIMAVLILEFRSFAASAVVAGVIPLGLLGGLVGLWLAGYSLSFTAVVGFIALIGIEIKNSILLVDFTTQLRQSGKGLHEAIEEAGEVRFLPVLLTSMTAIGGLIPLAVEGSGLYSPLAVVIISGLVSSTLLSRLVTPAMYLLLAPRDAGPGPDQRRDFFAPADEPLR